jgi:hypothetical protein
MGSLDLNWIRKEDKSLVIPPVVYEANDRYGGYYVHPVKGEIEIAGKFYDSKIGIIVISSIWPENIPSTLAHEWRHHWQFYQGWKMDSIGWSYPEDYEAAIRKYFLSSRCEFDALRFEYRKAKSELNDSWRGLILNA